MAIARVKMGAVLAGWVISFFILISAIIISIIALFASGFDFTSLSYGLNKNFKVPSSVYLTCLAVIFVAFFTGGYVAGRMAALSGMVNGGMIVATNMLFLVLIATLFNIVGKKLDINLVALASKTLAPFTPGLIGTTLLAIAGSILGGKLGEGYIDRLNAAISNVRENEDAAPDYDT